MKTTILVLSVILNLVLFAALSYMVLQGCAETPDGRIGILRNNLKVGVFGAKGTVLTLPKGLIVRDVSATGADWFEPNRFKIVVTSESADLVDYSANVPDKRSEYYSADTN